MDSPMDSQGLLLFHVAISLFAILAGGVVAYGLVTGRRIPGWTGLFLATTTITSVTGFFFHRAQVTPAQLVGALSLVLLALAVCALYIYRLRGLWRGTYVVTALAGFYLNMFVLVVQSFQKVPPLRALAPTQTEPAFLAAQILLLLLFVGLWSVSLQRFRPVIFA